ncbi:hypothetical protein NQF86_02705 [Bombella sp. TMW 2.2543]|uniref:DUF937 domain-containing protein n=1 Tax=Bombella pluederhausensis TaxID=2967336 RepID=A0ABT3WGV7_9PROT|nr:hypothetical protein [Bombella pluederhausensis]MCX5617584.1 hypothetical protein [Bombella pluederhausensis]
MSENNTPSSIIGGLFGLIEGAMGDSESIKTKTRLHLASTILGSISDEAASLLDDRFDAPAPFAGINRVESGLAEVEGGIHDVPAAVKEKKPVPTAAQVSSAA